MAVPEELRCGEGLPLDCQRAGACAHLCSSVWPPTFPSAASATVPLIALSLQFAAQPGHTETAKTAEVRSTMREIIGLTLNAFAAKA
jgi:hypothetical protein